MVCLLKNDHSSWLWQFYPTLSSFFYVFRHVYLAFNGTSQQHLLHLCKCTKARPGSGSERLYICKMNFCDHGLGKYDNFRSVHGKFITGCFESATWRWDWLGIKHPAFIIFSLAFIRLSYRESSPGPLLHYALRKWTKEDSFYTDTAGSEISDFLSTKLTA